MSRKIELTGAQAIVRCLVAENLSHVFGVAGGKLAGFMQAVSTEPSLTYIGTRHEANAAHMAAGFFAATGRMACVMGETGPGSLNLVTGIGGAFANHLPVIAISSSGQKYAAYPTRGMMMELDTEALMRPITKWNAVVHDGRRIPELMRRAFREALSGGPGPVHLDFVMESLGCRFEYEEADFNLSPEHYRPVHRPPAPGDQIAAAARLLVDADHPLLVGGGGVAVSEAAPEFRTLVALLNAPATATQMGIGIIASNDPHFIGHGGTIGGPAIAEAFAGADVVLSVGCRFNSWLWNEDGPLILRTPHAIQIDVDPSQIGKNAPVAVGIVADAKSALTDLIAAVRALRSDPPSRVWTDSLVARHRDHIGHLQELTGKDGVMHPAQLARAIAAALPEDALVMYDGGHTSFWSNDLTPVRDPRTRFHDPAMGQLGFGTPYAVAIKAAFPDRPVLNITGDGAFGFTLQELDTARRYGLPIVTIIHNNAEWGVIRLAQRHHKFDMGADLEDTNYAEIAKGFGCYGEVVHDAAEVGAALDRALSSGLPAVLDCRTFFEPHPCFFNFTRGLGAKDDALKQPPPK